MEGLAWLLRQCFAVGCNELSVYTRKKCTALYVMHYIYDLRAHGQTNAQISSIIKKRNKWIGKYKINKLLNKLVGQFSGWTTKSVRKQTYVN